MRWEQWLGQAVDCGRRGRSVADRRCEAADSSSQAVAVAALGWLDGVASTVTWSVGRSAGMDGSTNTEREWQLVWGYRQSSQYSGTVLLCVRALLGYLPAVVHLLLAAAPAGLVIM